MITLSLDSLETRSLPSTGLLPPLNEFAVTSSAVSQSVPAIDTSRSSSLASGFATDGQGADQIAYPRNRLASSTTIQADAVLGQYQTPMPNRQGIIAILIGL